MISTPPTSVPSPAPPSHRNSVPNFRSTISNLCVRRMHSVPTIPGRRPCRRDQLRSMTPPREFDRLSARDAKQWRALYRRYLSIGPHVSSILREPMPSWRALCVRCSERHYRRCRWSSAHPGPSCGGTSRVDKIAAMFAVWGMHLDFPPDIAGGALYPFLQCMAAQEKGLADREGGAQSLISALVRTFERIGRRACAAAARWTRSFSNEVAQPVLSPAVRD